LKKRSIFVLMKVSLHNKNTTKLTWTGGWDSTFRLLELLLNEKKVVQPLYVIRHEQCTGIEIDTMIKIRRALIEKYPETEKLMLPLIVFDELAVERIPEIDQYFEEMKKNFKMSDQYRVLATICHHYGIPNLETGIEGKRGIHKPDYEDESCLIFGNFQTNVFGTTKKEMELISEKNGWIEIMKLTTFCRRPRKGRPCGFCGPCIDIVDEGLGWRLPLNARIISTVQQPLRRYWRKNYFKQNSGFYLRVKKMLAGWY